MISETERSAVIKNISEFVGRVLSYIDITIEDSKDKKEKHVKKEVLKKLFEKDIYAAREVLLREDDSNVQDLFGRLLERLVDYSVAAISDKLQRATFNKLMTEAAQKAVDNLKVELYHG